MSNSIRENQRDTMRSVLFHFQHTVPHVQAFNGERKINPAFAQFMRDQGKDYKDLTLKEFVQEVHKMLSTANISSADNFNANNELAACWKQYTNDLQ